MKYNSYLEYRKQTQWQEEWIDALYSGIEEKCNEPKSEYAELFQRACNCRLDKTCSLFENGIKKMWNENLSTDPRNIDQAISGFFGKIAERLDLVRQKSGVDSIEGIGTEDVSEHLAALEQLAKQRLEERKNRFIIKTIQENAREDGIDISEDDFNIVTEIQKFGVTDEAALIGIAKLWAQENARELANQIENFGISNEAARIEIAKRCAQQDVQATVVCIQDFNITKEADRIEIAQFCAEQSSGATAEYIQRFEIIDEAALIGIAKCCANQNPDATAEFIERFKISEEAKLRIIARCFIKTELLSLFPRQHNSDLINKLGPIIHECVEGTLSTTHLKEWVVTHFGEKSPFLSYVQRLEQIKNPHARQQISLSVVKILFLACALSPQERAGFDHKLLLGLCNLPAPSLRSDLICAFAELIENKHALEVYARVPQNERSEEKRIAHLLFSLLEASGISHETIKGVEATFSFLLKEGVSARIFLQFLEQMHASPLLSPSEKERVLIGLCDGALQGKRENAKKYHARFANLKPELSFRIQAMFSLLLGKEEWRLKNGGSAIECCNAFLQEKFGLVGQDSAIGKFHELFMTERHPEALMIYASRLGSLKEPEVIRDLNRYVHDVLEGSFSVNRYMTPHLLAVEGKDHRIINRWKEPLELEKVELIPEPTPFQVDKWLDATLIRGGHGSIIEEIGLLEMSHVKRLLRNPNSRSRSFSPFEICLKNLLLAKGAQEQALALQAIEDQFKFYRFKDSPDDQVNILPYCEFLQDVRMQLASLKQPAKDTYQAHAVDTDNYLDLLLVGSEVSGSCQNVAGGAALNKGLLGYILDGKNRFLVIKDKKGSIIGRSKLSLLLSKKGPVLFLEKFYGTGFLNEQMKSILVAQALKKAALLGVDLAAAKGDWEAWESGSLGVDLQSLESGVSYEYSDVIGGVQPNGEFTISDADISLLKRKH